MRFNNNILERYLSLAPIPLAFERVLEAKIYQKLSFERPILDVGCGEGLFAKIIFAEKIDTGIDPDPGELQRAKELDGYAELICCKGNAIDKPDRHYKTVFSNSVLEHIPDVEPVFTEIHRLLEHGGKFYVTVPSNLFDEYSIVNQVLTASGLERLAKRYRQFFNSFWRHYHYYEPDQWAALAQKHGFAVSTIHTYGSKRSCLLNDCLAPFCIVSFLLKKVTNRWVWFSGLRSFFMAPVAHFGRKFLHGSENVPNGGLVFMELTKP